MKNENMSEVEQLWYALSAKFGNNRTWHELSAHEQQVFIDGINRIIAVLNNQLQTPEV